jgi:hypothetical protein
VRALATNFLQEQPDEISKFLPILEGVGEIMSREIVDFTNLLMQNE